MTWLALAALVALAYAGQGICSKKLLQHHPEPWVRWMLFLVATPLVTLYLAVRGLPDVEPRFWPLLGVAGLGGALSFWLFMRALRLTDLSIVYPLISLTPLFMVPVELVLIGDLPPARGALGVGTIVAGIYVLNLRRADTSALDPIRALVSDRGALIALALAGVWAVTGVIDKLAVQASSPAFYAPMVTAVLALLFAPSGWRARPGRTADGPTSPDRLGTASLQLLGLQGLLFAVMIVAQYEALRLTLVSYVISIKRAGTLLGVLAGYYLLGEGELGYRMAGAVLIVLGVVLLTLG